MRISHALVPAAMAAMLLLSAPATSQGGNSKLMKYLNSLPKQGLSTAELAQLRLLRQEEKLARDVYQVLALVWKIPAFTNIAKAEQSHMDLVAWVMQRYGIKDPLTSNAWGVYPDPQFSSLFVSLLQFGIHSKWHALAVGAFIEDLDIADLKHSLQVTDNRDLDTVWQNLQRGSRNHMRSFYGLLAAARLYYPGFVLSTKEILAIVNSAWETAPVDEKGVAL